MGAPYPRRIEPGRGPGDGGQGGDPPCWAHMLDDEGRVIGDEGVARAAGGDAPGPGPGEPAGDAKP